MNTSSGPESKDQGHRLKVPSPGRRSTHYQNEVRMRTLITVWVAVLGVAGTNVTISIALAAVAVYLAAYHLPRKARR